LGKGTAQKAASTNYGTGGANEAQPKLDDLDQAHPTPDGVVKVMAKKAAVTGETDGAYPTLHVAIGKTKDHKIYDSGYVATGKRKWAKKAVIPTVAVASRKGTKATGNLKGDRRYESGTVPTSAVASGRYESGYENLTLKRQEAARALPKGIYVENTISKIRLL
jgi:hypothetical protein